jgi:hypothetical protein
MSSLATPRTPRASLSSQLYESHYITATDPAGGRALWLRYTALKRTGSPARATNWMTYFDTSAPCPRALRITAPEPLRDPAEQWSTSSLGEFGPAGACGAIGGNDTPAAVREASWRLHWEPRAPELRYLPALWMYDRAVPRSNAAALVPVATTKGVLTLDGQQISLDGWDAIIGHNWGVEHPYEWYWIHAAGMGEDRLGWLDLVLVRIKIGPLLTPWIATGALHLDDHRYSPAPLRRVVCDRAGEQTTVRLSLSPRSTVELAITAPSHAGVSWDYASPRGPGRLVDNCSVADATLRLRSPTSSRSLTLRGTVAVEHGASGT